MAWKILCITEHPLTPFSGWRRVGNTIVNLFLANMKTGSNRHLVRELDPNGTWGHFWDPRGWMGTRAPGCPHQQVFWGPATTSYISCKTHPIFNSIFHSWISLRVVIPKGVWKPSTHQCRRIGREHLCRTVWICRRELLQQLLECAVVVFELWWRGELSATKIVQKTYLNSRWHR